MTDALINSIDINKSRKGKTVLDVPANELINSVAMFFKEKNVIKLPKWSSLVKCSHANEIVPLNPDYMYYKAAAIARMLYITKSKTVGVGSIRTMFGKKERRGAQPAKFMRASGKIIRVLLQQLKEEYSQMEFNSLKQNEETIIKQQQQLEDIIKINNDLTNKLNVQQQQKMLLLDETYLCTNVQYWTPQAMYKYIQAYSEQKGTKTSE